MFARSYTGAKASRLLADFLSPSPSADMGLVESLSKQEVGNLLYKYQRVGNTTRKDFWPDGISL